MVQAESITTAIRELMSRGQPLKSTNPVCAAHRELVAAVTGKLPHAIHSILALTSFSPSMPFQQAAVAPLIVMGRRAAFRPRPQLCSSVREKAALGLFRRNCAQQDVPFFCVHFFVA
jgi:hypothetical protein